MNVEKLNYHLASQLLEKLREMAEDVDTRADFEARRSEIFLARQLLREIESGLESTEKKLLLEWQKSTRKRLVWRLSDKRKLS